MTPAEKKSSGDMGEGAHAWEAARGYLAEAANCPKALFQQVDMAPAGRARCLMALTREKSKRVKNRAAKLLAGECERDPASAVSLVREFLQQVQGAENILAWNAMVALGALAPAMGLADFRRVVRGVQGRLEDISMVTAGHAITALGKMAVVRPECRERLLRALLIERSTALRDPGCEGILAGKLMTVLRPLVPEMRGPARLAMKELAEGHLGSDRSSTRRLAEKVMKELSSPSRRSAGAGRRQ